ncbi:MAG: hypothetical protein ABI678_28910 [Kofleriaceae bacterium]
MKRIAIIALSLASALAAAQPSGSASGSASASGSGSGSASGSGSGSGSASGSGSGSISGSGAAVIIQLDPQAPEVSAVAAPTELKLGGRFTLFVTAAMGAGVVVNLREPVDLGGAIEVGRRVSEDRTRADGKRVREWQIECRAWELGDVRVPPVAVTFTVLGKAGQVETNTVPLHVTGVLGDSDDPKLMRDSAPPVVLHEKSWLQRLVDWLEDPTHLAILIGALVGMWVGWRFRKLRRRRVSRLVGGLLPMNTPRRRIDMTSERALERLLAIEQSGALGKDAERHGAYAEMTDVIRDYLGARFNVLTTEMTSAELLRALAGRLDGDRVERWLSRVDIVKYGNFPATRDEAYDTLEGARTVVITTTASPPAASEKVAS